MATFGRNRQSIADIEQELHNIFDNHPSSYLNDAREPVIPADALVDVFRAFSEVYNGVELMTSDEMDMLKQLLLSNPGLEVTPQILLQFIAEKTKHSPTHTPNESPTVEEFGRGRADDRDGPHSRSSSNDSTGTFHRHSGSRPSSRGPPQTPNPFDVSRRQRSTPLNNAPSSWTKRPAPASRRKSDAGSRSDSESFSASPSAFGRTPGRTRAPSNPTSPSGMMSPQGTFSPVSSPPFAGGSSSRPHSRARSQPQSHFKDMWDYERDHSPLRDDEHDLDDDNLYGQDRMRQPISSLPMPRAGSDSDSDGEDSGLVMDRSAASSTVSMESIDRLDVLQRANAELGRKLVDAEKTLQNKLTQHEYELEDMQSRLDEMRSELSATKREEKELRSKERQNSTQIGALELEISKVTKALEHARSTYTSLQRQYQEQCTASEKYRADLRQRDETIRTLKESASLHEIETAKFAKEHESYEERIAQLENDLSIAQQAHTQLDEQKQENLLLKETIDRMRFDMDEMRNSVPSGAFGTTSGQSSAANTISKSLGAELLGKMKGWGMDDEEQIEEGDSGGSSPTEMGDDSESEDVIQTIITRKRKVASRANKMDARTFEEIKEYSDAYTQHEPAAFTDNHTTQTDPEPKVSTSSFSIQTDPPVVMAFATQTEPEPASPPRVTLDVEIQTDEPEQSHSRSVSPDAQDDEAMASSSSTVIPSTPKAEPVEHLHPDQPPAYHQINEREQEERDWRVAAETLKKWHHGAKIPFEPVPGGVSEEAMEEWKTLKEELGIECMVIDKVIANSEKTGQARPSRDGKGSPGTRKSRFYNIYNTYIYGRGSTSSLPNGAATQIVLYIGATALVLMAVSPYIIGVGPHYALPGGPTYYDRAAWSSFNTMQVAGEGFSPDGTAAVWNFLGRVGGGAARIARGWPT